MQEIVNFLIENPDILEKVVNGQASLIGVKDSDELLGIITGLTDGLKLLPPASFWK
ncbi:MAG: competence pheromone ComX [Bacillaceae bacterium]|jgi:competence protein ComX|uniref:competence pheromone ComX n=1 Tax=Aeribacillus sp. FSL K6-1121 TaxID=2954745 RepID=UPI000E3611F5|nr:MAG: competence pheromone ComX [Bacillaceae bacterium]